MFPPHNRAQWVLARLRRPNMQRHRKGRRLSAAGSCHRAWPARNPVTKQLKLGITFHPSDAQ